jgi:hypothetical protein
MQEMLEVMLHEKAKFSHALKAAAKLFASKREKENCMLTRQVAAMIKISTNASARVMPQSLCHLPLKIKTGPKGTILLPDYKALCVAFASYTRIKQLNNRQGTNNQGKLAKKWLR